MRLAVTENIIFRKMISGWPQISLLTQKWISPLIFTSIHFRKEREREKREERRESPDQRERDDRASPRRRAARSTSALVSRRTIAPLIDLRAVRVRRAPSSIAPLDRRSRRSSARWGAIVPLSLWSGLSLLSSLSDRGTSVLPDLMHFLVKRLNEPNTKINFP